MAVPAWATDLTDVWLDAAATTGWTILGTGAISADTDFYIQAGATNKNCISKIAWTAAIKGMIYSAGTFSVGTDGVVIAWGFYSASASLQVRNPGAATAGGLMLIVGSATTAYNRFNVAGSDTLAFDSWVPYVVNPDNSLHDGGTVGSPSATESYVGIEANLPTAAGPSKGNPLAIDAVRYGRGRIEYTAGGGGSADNSFTGADGYANAALRRWGLIELSGGVFRVQGFHCFGTAAAAVSFVDSNKALFIRDTVRHATSGFNRFEIMNAASVVTWTNISITNLGTVSKGTFVTTAGSLTLASCQFTDMDTFIFLSTSAVTNTVFRRCAGITAPGTTMTGTQILVPTVTANTSALIWDVATDPDGKLNNMTFTQSATVEHHAIEFGTSSPTTMTIRGITFTDFDTANGANGSVLHIKRTSGTVTINTVGCSGTVSYKAEGTTTVFIVADPVTVVVTTKDINGDAVGSANVFLKAASGGSGILPVSATVNTITRSSTTATATHAAVHNMSTGDKVYIQGADQNVYNGVFTITVTTTTAYTYSITSDPGTNATGTLTATFVFLKDTTNASTGVLSMSRVITADQNVTGWARKTVQPDGPFYKTAIISGTALSASGFSATVLMISDT